MKISFIIVLFLHFSLSSVFSADVEKITVFDDFENTISTFYEHIAEFEDVGSFPPNMRGSFKGIINNRLVIAGGTVENGDLVSDIYWSDIDCLTQWHKDSLDYPIGFGGSIIFEQKLVCIGGKKSNGFSADVFTLEFEGDNLIQKQSDWNLPEPIAYHSAAFYSNRVFIIGGLLSKQPKEYNPYLYVIEKSNNRFNQIRADSLKSKLPVAEFQNDGIYVFSGSDVHRISYEHVAGTKIQKRLKAPIDLGICSAAAIGQSHILISCEKYPSPLMYHTITDTFTRFKDSPETGFVLAIAAGDEVLFAGQQGFVRVVLTAVRGLMRATDYLIILLYLASLIAVGFYFSKREKSTENFFVGGRKVPTLAVAFSLFATGTSGISFMAIPAKSYMTDLLFFGAVLISVFFSISIAFIMPYLRGLQITSIYEYLEMRFDKYIRLAGAGICLAYELGARMSIAMYIPAVALSAVTGIDIMVSILVMGILATVYTVLGGIEAVIWSDVIQSVVMIGGALVAAFLLISGTDGGVTGYINMNAAYNKFKLFDFRWDYTLPVFWVMAANCFAVAAQNISNQSMLQRVFCTKDKKQARNSQLLSTLVGVSMAFVFWGIGTMLFTFFKSNPASLIPALPDDSVFPLFIVKNIPVGLCGLVIAGLFSASMSTLDSSMNTASAVFVTDFYSKIKPNATEKQKMVLARTITVIVGVVGTAFALLLAGAGIKSIFDIWMTLAALLLSSLPAVMLLGLFTKRVGKVGAYVAVFVAIVAAVTVRQTPMHFFLYSFTIIVSAFLCGYLVSFLFPQTANLAGLTIYKRKT